MSNAIVYSSAGLMQEIVDSAIVLNVHEINTLYRQKNSRHAVDMFHSDRLTAPLTFKQK